MKYQQLEWRSYQHRLFTVSAIATDSEWDFLMWWIHENIQKIERDIVQEFVGSIVTGNFDGLAKLLDE